MTYKVIQWATGGVGRAAIEGVIDHPELELVGCWVHSESKDGKDVGELIGRDPIGVTATRDVDALLGLGADCVIYSPIVANPKEVARILSAGINVVTPLGWIYPKRIDTEKVEAACAEGGATLHGTGIHPGGITERFPLMVSGLSRAITHVMAEEFSDIRTYGAPDVVGEMMLFGKTPEEAKSSPMLRLLGGGFFQSVDMVADAIGLELDEEKRALHEMAVATAPIESPIGVIEPGLVAGQRFCWQGLVDGEPVIEAAVNWFMGDQDIEPAPGCDPGREWRIGEKGERFEVHVTGDPSTHLTFKGWHPSSIEEGLVRNKGIVATAMHCVSAVPYTCAAGPGIKTYLDLPLIAGRAAPHLLPGSDEVVILDRFRLDGQVAIVTGAGKGIGRGIALGLAEAGADVVCAARTPAEIESTAEAVRSLGRRALAIPTDVTDTDALERLVEATVAELGRIDVLVNNAGGTGPRAALDTSERFFEAALRFNVTSAFLLSRLVIPKMVETAGGGAIVNISSRSSDMVQTSFVAYGAAKAALNMMTRNLAAEVAPKVRVNAISVGGVETEGLAMVLTNDAIREQFESNTPMRRPGQPEDIACAALYLASPAASWVTGKIFQIDGGTEAPAMSVPTPQL